MSERARVLNKTQEVLDDVRRGVVDEDEIITALTDSIDFVEDFTTEEDFEEEE